MRTTVLALAALLALPAASALALVPPGALDGPAEAAPREAAAEGARRVEAVLRAQDGPVDAWLQVADGDGRVVASWRARLEEGQDLARAADVAPGRYVVTGGFDSGQFQFSASSAADLSACPGSHRNAFLYDDGRVFQDLADTGCLTPLPEALALRAEAERARGAPLLVPLPSTGDRGLLLSWGSLAEPRWEDATRDAFRWETGAFPDEWGRTRQGALLRHQSSTLASCGTTLSAGGQDVVTSSPAAPLVETAAFAEGATEPTYLSEALCSSDVTLGSEGLRNRVRQVLVSAYGARQGVTCTFRSGVQGATLVPGEAPPAAPCPGWTEGVPGAWLVGAPAEHRGFRAVPVYFLSSGEGRWVVARLWLAEGVPHPLDAERHAWGAPGFTERDQYRLAGFEHAGDPLPASPAHPPAEAPPSPTLAPLDPLRGPALLDATHAARLRLTLAEASDAARADPTLGALQDVLTRPRPVLALAGLSLRQEPGSPVAVERWLLGFSAAGAAAAYVECSRPAAPGAPALPSPLVRCRESSPSLADVIPEGLDAGALPPLGATFDLALARWDGWRADAGEGRVAYARYRIWGDDLGGAQLAVGFAPPQRLAPLDLGEPEPLDYAAVDVATGRALRHVSGLEKGAQVAEVAEQVVPVPVGARAAAPGDASSAFPPLAGAGLAAAGLLTLLLLLLGPLKPLAGALYTRLVRAKVLDSDARARIHALVAEEPGIHAGAIIERLGRGNGLAEYHLGVLVREGLLACVQTKGFRRYFVAGRFSPGEMRARAVLREGHAEAVFRIVRGEPGIHLGALARRAGLSMPHASRTVKRLVEAGLVERAKAGRAVTLWVAEGAPAGDRPVAAES